MKHTEIINCDGHRWEIGQFNNGSYGFQQDDCVPRYTSKYEAELILKSFKACNIRSRLVEALKAMQITAEVAFEDLGKHGHLSPNHGREYRQAKQNARNLLSEIKDGEK